MPVDRFLHPRIGDSEKVGKLTDMEFRVWIIYMLAADDFGVLPMMASKIQAVDRTLANRRRVQVDRALQTLVSVGLVRSFDHQGQLYIFSPGWQTHQRIRHPRKSHFPKPADSDLITCDRYTIALFDQHDGPVASTSYQENLGNISPDFVLARAGAREEANGKRLTATGNGNGEQRDRFERWWSEYPKKVGKDAAWREWLKRSPADDLTDQMIAKVREQCASRDWRKDNGQFIPHPRTWLSQGRWEDELTIPVATNHDRPSWKCRHLEQCSHRAMCESKTILGRPERAEAAS